MPTSDHPIRPWSRRPPRRRRPMTSRRTGPVPAASRTLPVHPPEHAHLRRPRQRAESCSEPCPTVQSLEPVTFLLA